MNPQDVLTTSQICHLLHITRPTLYAWVGQKRLQPWKTLGNGATSLFLRSDLSFGRLKRYARSQRQRRGRGADLTRRAMARILIVSRDRETIARLFFLLKGLSCQAFVAGSGVRFESLLMRVKPEVVILDLAAQDREQNFLRHINHRYQASAEEKPAIFALSGANAGTEEAASALREGAWDFAKKPLVESVFLARLRWMLKRRLWADLQAASAEDLVVSRDRCVKVNRAGRLVEVRIRPQDKEAMVSRLTPKERDLLCLFLSRPGRIFSKSMLLEIIWGYSVAIKTRTVDRHIENLRQKLRPQQHRIETHYGMGYSFSDPG